MKSLENELSTEFPQLLSGFGFKVIESSYYAESFGDSLVTLKSPHFLLRIIRDRGQVFADISGVADPLTWWRLEDVCALISGSKIDTKFVLSAIVNLLNHNLPALTEYMGSRYEQTQRELQNHPKLKLD